MSEIFSTKIDIGNKVETSNKEGRNILSFKGADKVIGTEDFNEDDTPASLFEDRHGFSIIAKQFNNKYVEDENTRQKLKAIDFYIQDKIIDDELEDNQKVYKTILNNLIRTLGIDPNDMNKLDKIYQSIMLKQFLNK